MDTGNKAFVQFNENVQNYCFGFAMYSLELEIKLKKNNKIHFRPTFPIFPPQR
jgi:hypothetical protein